MFYGSYDYYFYYNYYDNYGYHQGAEYSPHSTLGFLIGPDFKYTLPNNSSIIAGLGYGSVNEQGSFYLRAGYKTRKSFFVTGETLIGDGIGFGVGLGFSFGGKPRN